MSNTYDVTYDQPEAGVQTYRITEDVEESEAAEFFKEVAEEEGWVLVSLRIVKTVSVYHNPDYVQ